MLLRDFITLKWHPKQKSKTPLQTGLHEVPHQHEEFLASTEIQATDSKDVVQGQHE